MYTILDSLVAQALAERERGMLERRGSLVCTPLGVTDEQARALTVEVQQCQDEAIMSYARQIARARLAYDQ